MALLSAKGRNPWLDVLHSMPRHLVKDNQSRGPLDRLHGYLEHMQWGPLVDWLIRQDVRLYFQLVIVCLSQDNFKVMRRDSYAVFTN